MNLYIVTGTTRGLGRALAEAIARDAANELIALSSAPDADIPGGVRFQVDLADTAALEKAFDRVDARLRGRRYDKAVLFNNAGIVDPVAPLADAPPDAIERNIAVNLVAPLLLMRRFLIATEGIAPLRRIINISSGAGRRPVSGWSAYCAAKAGLDMASRVVALEAGGPGGDLQVASLAPGVIDTDMQTHVRSLSAERFADVERFRRMHAQGELRSAESVAAEILERERGGQLEADAILDLRTLAS